MISFFRTVSLLVTAIFATFFLGLTVIVAALLGVKHREGDIYGKVPRWWSTAVLWAVGVKVRVYGLERVSDGKPYIFASNHVSWFDVPALAKVLPRYKFVAKAELFKVPIFGKAMRAAGMIEIQRENRKAAFGAYDVAAERIRAGNSVVVFPEGHAWACVSSSSLQEGSIRAGDRRWSADRSGNSARHNRDHAEGLHLGSFGND